MVTQAVDRHSKVEKEKTLPRSQLEKQEIIEEIAKPLVILRVEAPAQSGSYPSPSEEPGQTQTGIVAAVRRTNFLSPSLVEEIEEQQAKQERDHKQEPSELLREEAGRYLKLGLAYYYLKSSRQGYIQEMNRLEESATQGDANAQYALGTLYRNGQGVLQDYDQAKAWYEASAMQGNADAQYMLGVLYHYGEGVPSDFVQAREWYEKAAAQGNAYAINGLANIPKGYVRRRERSEKAASQVGKLANTPLKDSKEQKLKKEGRLRGWFSLP
jgi:TPR repeat protein